MGIFGRQGVALSMALPTLQLNRCGFHEGLKRWSLRVSVAGMGRLT